MRFDFVSVGLQCYHQEFGGSAHLAADPPDLNKLKPQLHRNTRRRYTWQ
jgi:hypothetical protein